MRKSVVALAAGLMVIGAAGMIDACTPETPPRSVQRFDDGERSIGVAPWVEPSAPFPSTCANEGYCLLGTDSICTIILVMLNQGTAETDIVAVLRPQHDLIHADDFTNCRGFQHYWSPPPSAEAA